MFDEPILSGVHNNNYIILLLKIKEKLVEIQKVIY